MNYILSATRDYNGLYQSVNVKLKGGRGQCLPTMRSWASILTQFDFTTANFPNYTGDSIIGSNYKSMTYSSMKSEINRSVSESSITADVSAVIRWKQYESEDSDLARNTIIKVYNTTYSTVANDIKQQFYYLTGKNYDDNRLCIVNLNISLKLSEREEL